MGGRGRQWQRLVNWNATDNATCSATFSHHPRCFTVFVCAILCTKTRYLDEPSRASYRFQVERIDTRELASALGFDVIGLPCARRRHRVRRRRLLADVARSEKGAEGQREDRRRDQAAAEESNRTTASRFQWAELFAVDAAIASAMRAQARTYGYDPDRLPDAHVASCELPANALANQSADPTPPQDRKRHPEFPGLLYPH